MQVSSVEMTPMCKFIYLLMITGEILIYESTTGIVVSSIKTGVSNCDGMWIGHLSIEDELKEEGKID
jgi:hypothetical protein